MNQSIWAEPEAPASQPEQETQARDTTSNTEQISIEPAAPAASFLSAAATTFSPDTSAPPPDVATAETFAQTGAQQDDLFDDIVPVEESMRIRSDEDLFSDDFTPALQPVLEQPKPQPVRGPTDGARGRGRGRGTGRGEGRGGQTRNEPRRDTRMVGDMRKKEDEQRTQPQEQSAAPSNAPTGPRKDVPPSVRGDRFATGGVKKPKLTEEELAEKMAKIQIKNASLTAAHARAEADAASFAEREQQAKQVSAARQKEERRDRQQMMGEREKNRMRKLKAMEGREWDAEKNDDDFQRGGKFDKKGAFAEDKGDYTDGREYLYREPRGGRGGSRGGRGGRPQEPAAPPKREDFPALPSTSKADAGLDPSLKPSGKSWADQVEAS